MNEFKICNKCGGFDSDILKEKLKELDKILPQQEKRNKSWELSPKDIEEQRLQQVGIAEKHREEKESSWYW